MSSGFDMMRLLYCLEAQARFGLLIISLISHGCAAAQHDSHLATCQALDALADLAPGRAIGAESQHAGQCDRRPGDSLAGLIRAGVESGAWLILSQSHLAVAR
jgi:hypothetical protein